MQIINTAKAIIRTSASLLALRCGDGEETYYTLPGGQQRAGELLPETVQRECLEEIGCSVHVGELVLVCERPDFGLGHMVDHYFICHLNADASPRMGAHPDCRQQAVEWIPVELVPACALHPLALRGILAGMKAPAAVYAGRAISEAHSLAEWPPK